MVDWGLELVKDYVSFLQRCGGRKPAESVRLNPGVNA